MGGKWCPAPIQSTALRFDPICAPDFSHLPQVQFLVRTTDQLMVMLPMLDLESWQPGASYAGPNTRVHLYLDVPGVSREQDYTWFPGM